MANLFAVKGNPRRLMYLVRQDQRLELLIYPDGSYGIARDGQMVGVWEPAEEEQCVAAFASFADLKGAFPKIILHRPSLNQQDYPAAAGSA